MEFNIEDKLNAATFVFEHQDAPLKKQIEEVVKLFKEKYKEKEKEIDKSTESIRYIIVSKYFFLLLFLSIVLSFEINKITNKIDKITSFVKKNIQK